jgi:hypothetical protein
VFFSAEVKNQQGVKNSGFRNASFISALLPKQFVKMQIKIKNDFDY